MEISALWGSDWPRKSKVISLGMLTMTRLSLTSSDIAWEES